MIKSAKVSATYNVVETFCESEKERSDDKMKKKFVAVEGTIKVKIKKKFVAFLWGGTLLLAQDVILIVVVMALVK